MLVELSVMEQRYHAVMEVVSGAPVSEVARRYGVSRQAVYGWLGRYEGEGLAGLADHSHRPAHQPRQLDAQVEALVCQLRGTHPRWGPRRLLFELGKAGVSPLPSRSTIYRVLVRHHLVPARKHKRRRQDYKRWQREEPMQLWQMDITGSVFLADGTELKLISGIDDHSRFCVIATVVRRATARAVCRAFVAAMRLYGIPDEVLTDNGKQFTGRFGKPRPAEVLFERICRKNGIKQRLTRPYSPTTTGKVERWHQSLQTDFLNDTGPFAPSPPRRLRSMPGGPSTTPSGRINPWIWLPPPHGSGPRRTAVMTSCSCGRLLTCSPLPGRRPRPIAQPPRRSLPAGRRRSR